MTTESTEIKTESPSHDASVAVQPVVMAEFINGMTVRQLKATIKEWPEINEYTGEECEVWIGVDGTSNQARLIVPLNRRDDNGAVSADILIEP